MLNALTIDLEDYFQVHAFSNVIRFEDWGNYESRIEHNTHRLLEILNEPLDTRHSALRTPVRATFFALGWLAERYPHLIRAIREEGHEIASHGYDHRLIYNTTPEKFREDVRKSKGILEDITGDEVIGYRAPSYSITNKSQWAFEVLMEEGFKYDSSIFPIHHDFYGFPQAPRFPFLISMNGNSTLEFQMLNLNLEVTPQSAIRNPQSSTQSSALNPDDSDSLPQTSNLPPLTEVNPINSTNPTNSMNSSNPATRHSSLVTRDSLLEFPLSTVRICGQNIPISGGGYFRLLPYPIIKKGLRRINGQEEQPFIFYIHPWEIDPDQPKMNSISRRSRFRHYVNLSKTESRFKKLLADFHFSAISDLLNGSTAVLQYGST